MSDTNHVHRGNDLDPLPAELAAGGTSRRSFLKLTGFGLAGATLGACSRAPVQKLIPHLVPVEEIVPGRAYWIATTCGGCRAGCGVLAKCRDGRPVKVEGNPQHPVNSGGLCPVGQAQVLSLYDSHRLSGPRRGSQVVSWAEFDADVIARLEAARSGGGSVRLLTGTVHGPSTLAAIRRFLEAHPGARHVTYDPLSASAILDAHERTHGVRALPRYLFDQVDVVASFDADFLGTWISPVEFARGYAAARSPEAAEERAFCRHVQFEARMSLTGSRADRRHALAPNEQQLALADLCDALAAHAGRTSPPSASVAEPELADAIRRVAAELWAARGRALVLAGANDVAVQTLVNHANHLLGGYGNTLSLGAPSQQRRGNDGELEALRAELEADRVDVLIVQGANPAYDLPPSFREALRRARTLVACTAEDDETAALAHFVQPEPHALEAWDDAHPAAGVYSVAQPTLPRLRETRSLRAGLARWCGDARDDRELVRATWRAELHPLVPDAGSFDVWFDRVLHDGVLDVRGARAEEPAWRGGGIAPTPVPADLPRGEFALVLYPKVALLDGSHAHNPWLQELPDPVTKVVWDNYACLGPVAARELGVTTGDVVRIGSDDTPPLELPVLVQPGQHERTVAVALGYGRRGTERFERVGPSWWEGRPTTDDGGPVGRSAGALLRFVEGSVRSEARRVRVERTSRKHDLACTQEHHTLAVPEHLAPAGGEVRPCVPSTTFDAWKADPHGAVHRGHVPHADLWPDDHRGEGPRWGMVVDLTACTGCSACVVGCQSENNVPVVGRDEVRRHREMHWIRVDRYWEGEGGDTRATHQPMMCQHCGNAPCETVCPVLATVHGREGLNQQVYNRCVGTRYCANNCPYKVRRFNWFDYPHEDRLQNLSLNPDVTIRTRGVMEKCSFCVQRILEARSAARERGEPLADGEIRTACQQSCPTRAIEFGDLADPESRVSRLTRSMRSYHVLGELNVRPSVAYQAVVRHRDADGRSGKSHGH